MSPQQMTVVVLLVTGALLLALGFPSHRNTSSQLDTIVQEDVSIEETTQHPPFFTDPAPVAVPPQAAVASSNAAPDYELKNTSLLKAQAPTSSAAAEEITVPAPLHNSPSLAVEVVNERTRAAVVNILCTAAGSDLQPVSGSGVIIDGSGVVLTNAHIGQYVLLQDTSPVAIDCFVRTGSPAQVRWKPRILFISREWVHEHAKDIRTASPTGTGENDFALLALEPMNEPLSLPLFFVPPDTREGVVVDDDSVLAASYPAGFAGALTIYNQLSLASTLTTIKKLYTFTTGSIDLVSLGGIIVAQQGSSGGAVVDAWGNLVALVVTSSNAATTAGRDLRAMTLSHIDRAINTETGSSLAQLLLKDPREAAARYKQGAGAALGALITREILGQ